MKNNQQLWKKDESLPDPKLEKQKSRLEKTTSSKSFFQIFSMIIICLLVIAIIVQIVVIINLKQKTDDLQDKLNNLPSVESQVLQQTQSLDFLEINF